MPNLNHKGPEGKGSKTGRKLGNCRKTEADLTNTAELGKGLGNHYHNPDAVGNGKRINYYKTK